MKGEGLRDGTRDGMDLVIVEEGVLEHRKSRRELG